MFQLASSGSGLSFTLCGADATAMPCGALWLPHHRTLVVSDLHLEKGSAYARRGQLLPPWDTAATLARLAAAVDAVSPAQVVALGDSFHDMEAGLRIAAQDRATLVSLASRIPFLWIEGNHDPAPPGWAPGERSNVFRLGSLTLRHEPSDAAAPGEIAGHLHPCAKVAGAGRQVRRRCFATDGARLVMPAYGAFAGGLNVRDDAFAPLFAHAPVALMLGRDRVYAAAPGRLTSDRATAQRRAAG